MTQVLDRDVAELGPAAARFWAWWTRELRALAAPLVRERSPRRDRWPLIDVTPDGRLEVGTPDRAVRKVALRLPAERVLRRALAMPALGVRDLERLVRLDADRLTPFAEGTAYHHLVVGATAGEDGARDVRLLSVSRGFVDQALADAQAQGRDVRALWAPDEHGRIDLLPLVRAGRPDPARRLRRTLWAAALALVALNLGVWVWRDGEATRALEARAEAADARARRVAQASLEARALSGLLDSAASGADRADPLFALDAVGRALPAGATLQRLEWRDGQVRLAGVKPAELDVAAALRSDPAFGEVRDASGAAASSDRFELAARLSQLRRPAS